jgi:hypothetical protein
MSQKEERHWKPWWRNTVEPFTLQFLEDAAATRFYINSEE